MRSVTRIRALVGLALALGLAGLATGCVGAHKHHKAKPARTLAPVTKRSGCRLHGGLPDSSCTPGAVLPDVKLRALCTPGYSKRALHVSGMTRELVYAAYGIKVHPPGRYEIDHLVSLGLGGSNVQANLWPEQGAFPGYHDKNTVVNYLHAQVCQHRLALATAQQELAHDWLALYRRIPTALRRRYRT